MSWHLPKQPALRSRERTLTIVGAERGGDLVEVGGDRRHRLHPTCLTPQYGVGERAESHRRGDETDARRLPLPREKSVQSAKQCEDTCHETAERRGTDEPTGLPRLGLP